jgi:hypothetical protein
MKVRRFFVGLIAIVLVCAVFGTPIVWSQTQYLVAPADTDVEIDLWIQPHVVEIDRSIQSEDVLFVHFPGSFDIPTNSELILQHAARRGFPAIGLRYPNSWTVNGLCRTSSDAGCFEDVRMEILDGVDRTDRVTISEANSITNRLVKLLQYLDAEFPDDEWGRFLSGAGDVVWSKITVGGHSQGAGHAAMVGHVHRVNRVGMFAGVTDYSSYFGAPPAWLSDPGATPMDVHYGFGHSDDSLVPEDVLLEIWTAQGLADFGDPVVVDDSAPPYAYSHMFFTNAEPADSGSYQFHNSVVMDQYTPKNDDGTARFSEIWEFMCFPGDPPDNSNLRVRRPGRRMRPQ